MGELWFIRLDLENVVYVFVQVLINYLIYMTDNEQFLLIKSCL
jgi:hypothetical protein